MNAWHIDWRRIIVALTTGIVVAATAASAGRTSEFPTLLPGETVVVVGTHVSCTVTASSVLCKRAGGLAATLNTDNKVSVLNTSQPVPSSPKSKKLGTSGGFVLVGSGNNSVYCHVYMQGSRTLSCAMDGGSTPGARGFDITDSQIVFFSYDKAGVRHDLKSYRQP